MDSRLHCLRCEEPVYVNFGFLTPVCLTCAATAVQIARDDPPESFVPPGSTGDGEAGRARYAAMWHAVLDTPEDFRWTVEPTPLSKDDPCPVARSAEEIVAATQEWPALGEMVEEQRAAQKAAVSCATLLSNEPHDLPNHVCYGVALRSVQRYRAQKNPGTLTVPIVDGRITTIPAHMGTPSLVVRREIPDGAVLLVGSAVPVDEDTGEAAITDAASERGSFFAEPEMLLYRRAAAAGDLRNLENTMDSWYSRTLLGKGMPGHPRGGPWDSRQELDDEIVARGLELLAEGESMTWANIAGQMGISPSALYGYRRDFGVQLPSLKRRARALYRKGKP